MRHAVDPLLAVGQSLEGFEQFGLFVGVFATGVTLGHVGITPGAAIDSHLQGPNHLQLGDRIDQRRFARLALLRGPLAAAVFCLPDLSGPLRSRRSFPAPNDVFFGCLGHRADFGLGQPHHDLLHVVTHVIDCFREGDGRGFSRAR